MILSIKHLIKIILPIIILLMLLVPACTPPQQPKYGFNPQLSISEPPVLGKPVKVTLTFTPQKEFDTYSMQIILPPEMYEVIEGNLEKHGVTGAAPYLEVTIKSIRIGVGGISGIVKGDTPRSTSWENRDLFIQISNDDATVSTTQPKFEPQRITPTLAYPATPRTLLPKPSGSSEAPKPSDTISPSRLPPAGGNAPQKPTVGFKPELSISEALLLGIPVLMSMDITTEEDKC